MSNDNKKSHESLDAQMAKMKELKAQTEKIQQVYDENVISLEKMVYMWGKMRSNIKGIPEALEEQNALFKSINESAEKLSEKYAASEEDIIRTIDLLRQKIELEEKLSELENKERNGVITDEEVMLFCQLDDKLKSVNESFKKTGYLGEQLAIDMQDQNSSVSQQLKLQQELVKNVSDQKKRQKEVNAELEKSEKRLQKIKQSGITDIFSGAWTILKNVISKGVNQWQNIEQMSYDFGRQMGMTGEQLQQHNAGITKNYGDMARTLGMEVKEIYKFQTGYAEATDKAVLLTTTQISSMAALSRNTGEQAISVANKNLDVFATSADATVEYLAKGSARAALEGLNVKKYSEAFANNIKMASKYTFSEGISGIQKMTLLSQRLKFNMESIGAAMDKFSTIEGAIDTGSKLQVLGGSFAQNFGNPLEAMSEALLDGEAFTQRIIDSVANTAKFNTKTGELDLAPIDKQRLKAAASAMGISYDELHNMATQSKKEDVVSSAVAGKKLSEEQKTYLTNKAQFNKETGKWHLTNADGSMMEKDISQMTSKEIDEARGADSYEKILAADVGEIHHLLADKVSNELTHIETIKGFEGKIAADLANLLNGLPTWLKWVAAAIAGSQLLGGIGNIGRLGKGLFKGIKSIGRLGKGLFNGVKGVRGVSAISRTVGSVTKSVSNGARSMKVAYNMGKHGMKAGSYGIKATAAMKAANTVGKAARVGSKLGGKIAAPLVILDAGMTAYGMYGAQQDYKKNVAEIKESNQHALRAKAKTIREEELARNKAMTEGGIELGAMGIGAAIGSILGPAGALVGAGIGGLVGWGANLLGLGGAVAPDARSEEEIMEELRREGHKDDIYGSEGYLERGEWEQDENAKTAEEQIKNKVSNISDNVGGVREELNTMNGNLTQAIRSNSSTQTDVKSNPNGNKVEVGDIKINGEIKLSSDLTASSIDMNQLMQDSSFRRNITAMIQQNLQTQTSGRVTQTSVS